MADRFSIDEPAGYETERLTRNEHDRENEHDSRNETAENLDLDLDLLGDDIEQDLDVFGEEIAAERALEGANRLSKGAGVLRNSTNKIASFLNRKTVSWGPSPYDTNSGADDGGTTVPKDKPHRLANLGASRNGSRTNGRYQGLSGAGGGPSSDSDSDLDSDVDIEIDLETHPTRRRARNTSLLRKMHLLLFLVFVLGGLVFYSNILSPPSSSKPGSGQKYIKKTVLNNGTHDYYPTTIVVSLDGMHPHYVSEDLTPHMHELFTKHAAAPYMSPSFPSLTFPNHWTLITGLYPANHGIIANSFWDAKTQRQFISVKPQLALWPQWWGGEPLWDTARASGVKAVVHMWPGSEVHWPKGRGPLHFDTFNQTESLSQKASNVLSWLDQDKLETRPELIMAYVPNVDALGHQHGIHGPEIRQVLKDTDKLIGDILKGIKDRNLDDIVNLVVLSDHGMAPTNNTRLVYLEDLVNLSDFSHNDGAPLVGLRPKSDLKTSVDDIYKSLKAKEPSDASWRVYLDSNMPKEWHFGGSHTKYESRIAPLWIIPGVGWAITTRDKLKEMGGVYKPFGVHGYNNTETLMRAMFLAKGPYFGHDYYAPFANVDVYNILCDTLGLTPAPNDGARNFLKKLPKDWHDPQNYPGVKFHTEVLKVNATYDLLFSDEHTEDVELEQEHKSQSQSVSQSASQSVVPSTLSSVVGAPTASKIPEDNSHGHEHEDDDDEDDDEDEDEHEHEHDHKHGDDDDDNDDDDDDESVWEIIEDGAEDLLDDVKDWFGDVFGGKGKENSDHDH